MEGLGARRWLLALLAIAAAACSSPKDAASSSDAAQADPARTTPYDAWITAKIQSQYFVDAEVRRGDIDVDTTNGTVVLSGRVDEDGQKARAERIAMQTDGVRSVDNQIVVGEPQRRDGRATPAGSTRIPTEILARYFADDRLRGSEIDVVTLNGVVSLLGTVPSEPARQRAVAVARSVEGVRDVDDRLRVDDQPRGTSGSSAPRDARGPIAHVEDAEVTMRIQARYFRDEDVRGRTIDVDTINGAVRLSGEVGSEYERQRAVRIAQATVGVASVEDQLVVVADELQGTAAATEPRHPVADAWITTKIQSKYFLDRDVNATAIAVSTDRGTVTLAGRVDSGETRRRAVELARATGGVRQVIDRLVVDSPGSGGVLRER